MSGGLELRGGSMEVAGARRPSLVMGLLWREWTAHRRMVELALSVWLVGGWVLMIFDHPGWIIAYGVLYAWAAGQRFGGSEAGEGTEEFAFALPPTRRQRYLVRLAAGGGSVAALSVAALLTILLNLPQRLWGLVVESGFTEPFPPCDRSPIYTLAVIVPLAFFAMTFPLAANSRSRGAVGWAGAGGWLGAGGTVLVGVLVERQLWHGVNGYVCCPALIVLGGAAVAAGYAAYLRKEGISRPERLGGERRWSPWILAVIVLIMALTLFLFSVRVQTAGPPPGSDEVYVTPEVSEPVGVGD